jgi:hypothetical protein
MSPLAELLVSGLLPLGIITLTFFYKRLAKPPGTAGDDESLAVFELLFAALILAVTTWVSAEDPSEAQVDASIVAVVSILALLPMIAFGLREARYRSNNQLPRNVLWTANGIGFIVFSVTYLATHYGISLGFRSYR